MRVEKRINEIVNRLNKTKVERKPDLKGKPLFSPIILVHYKTIEGKNVRQGSLKLSLLRSYCKHHTKSTECFSISSSNVFCSIA